MCTSNRIKFIGLLVFLVVVAVSCKKSDLKVDAPSCIEDKINELKKNPVQNPPAEVWEWKFNGKTYYYFTSDCCDQFNYLYDSNCNVVCAPDGGFTGSGDGNCPDFNGHVEKTLVWADDRK